jgi:DNA uptake protein ComE-like DNA-binding protein
VLIVIVGVLAFIVSTATLQAQVGKSLGVVDANVAAEKDLLTFPHMTPAIVKGILEKRPFNSITDLNAYLLSQGLTAAQAMEFYTKAIRSHQSQYRHARRDPPGPWSRKPNGSRIPEYRPWKTWAQFDKEIGKYVGQEATDKLKQYTFIPINLNTATDEDFLTIPGVANRMVREFKEYRPWKTKAQFDKEIGKYVGEKETARFWRFMVIQ